MVNDISKEINSHEISNAKQQLELGNEAVKLSPESSSEMAMEWLIANHFSEKEVKERIPGQVNYEELVAFLRSPIVEGEFAREWKYETADGSVTVGNLGSHLYEVIGHALSSIATDALFVIRARRESKLGITSKEEAKKINTQAKQLAEYFQADVDLHQNFKLYSKQG